MSRLWSVVSLIALLCTVSCAPIELPQKQDKTPETSYVKSFMTLKGQMIQTIGDSVNSLSSYPFIAFRYDTLNRIQSVRFYANQSGRADFWMGYHRSGYPARLDYGNWNGFRDLSANALVCPNPASTKDSMYITSPGSGTVDVRIVYQFNDRFPVFAVRKVLHQVRDSLVYTFHASTTDHYLFKVDHYIRSGQQLQLKYRHQLTYSKDTTLLQVSSDSIVSLIAPVSTFNILFRHNDFKSQEDLSSYNAMAWVGWFEAASQTLFWMGKPGPNLLGLSRMTYHPIRCGGTLKSFRLADHQVEQDYTTVESSPGITSAAQSAIKDCRQFTDFKNYNTHKYQKAR